MEIKLTNVRSLARKRLLNIIMRTFIFLMCTTVFCFNTENSFSQHKVIIEKDQLIAVDYVFKIIKKQTELNFVYPKGLFKNSPKVQLKKGEINASKLIENVLAKSHFNFELTENNTIIINEEAKVEVVVVEQENIVSGKVVDGSGLPIPGVNILIVGTSVGTQTDFDGKYSLKAKKGNVLQFSYMGFKSKKVTIANSNTINMVMEEEANALNEVVVIGYGTQKKSNLTAAITTVDTKDLENRPVKSVTEMLSASVPGLNITTNSGAPDAISGLNIRGFTGFNANGAPLVLVDGVPQDIEFVNANDIKSISVLKDAAASAIYGSRAPNGVILITTKSGTKGKKMQVNFSSDLVINQPLGIPQTANSYESSLDKNIRRYNSLTSPFYTDDALDRMKQYIAGEITTTNIIVNGKYGNVYQYNANVDHFDTAFRDNVYNKKSNLSISGGGDKTTYYASFGNITNDGIYNSDNDWLKRYFTVIKMNTEVNDWISIGLNSKYTRQQVVRPTIWSYGQNDGQLFTNLSTNPNLPDYDDNGSPNEFSMVPNLDGLSGSFSNTTDDIWLTGQIELKPVKGLSIKGDYTWSVKNKYDNNTQLVFGSYDADGTPKPSRRSPTLDRVIKQYSNTNYHNINLVATYNLDFEKHSLTVLAGYNEELNKFNMMYGTNTEFYTQSIPSISTSYGDSPVLTDAVYSWATQGYFGRLSYNFRETYLLDLNVRYDASSKYSPDTRWAFFPSVSVGYNVAKEEFWPLKDAVKMFKLKGSWGQLGNNAGSIYAYLPTLGTGSQTPVILDGGRLPFVTMPGIISSDLTWTKPRTIGFGVEMGALNNRLTIDYDWYQRTVFDQLGPAEQYSEVLGTAAPKRNNAVSETRGWELALGWKDEAFMLKGSPVSYGVRAGVSDYVGYVVEYESNSSGTRSGWTPGQVFGELYGYTSSGIAQSAEAFQSNPLWRANWYYPGDLLMADTNGDGVVNSGQGNYWYSQGDRKLLGYNYPRYKYYISLNAKWKGLSISALFDGVGKQSAYFANDYHIGTKAFLSQENLERGYWSLNNQDAYFPRAYDKNRNQLFENTANDQYVSNLAHLRIKNINISYSLPESILSKMKLRSLSVNVSGENLGMIYNKSWDKEYDPIQLDNGLSTYPISRVYSLGFKVGI